MALLVGDELLDELAGGPVGEVVGRGEILAIGREEGGFQHAIETGERDRGVVGHDSLVEQAAERGADVVGGAEAAELAAALADPAGVAGGFPDVLAEEIF
ncbi:MAG: hypothetical protein NTV51_26385 [Verrucomicrobia bacterium]|nr:hypothetical protein [Verrucomicrobiota bacterium]